MNKKEDRTNKKQQKREEKWQRQYSKVIEGNRFKKWRSQRPFWGATFTVLAALIILYIPVHLYAIAMIPGTFVFVGFLFGGLTLILGVLAYIYPQFSTVFGVVTIFLSVLSIMGALGGFIIGTIIGIVGGSLLIAWESEALTNGKNQDKKQNRSKKENNVSEQEAAGTVQN